MPAERERWDAEMAEMNGLPWIVSVDDHVIEPPHVWQTWLPARYRERGPKVEQRRIKEIRHRTEGGYDYVWGDEGELADCWVFEDTVVVHKRNIVLLQELDGTDDMADPNARTITPARYSDMRTGCYDPQARLRDMDVNHTDASLCFPTFPRFCGQLFTEATTDRDLGLACVRAYNDWMVQEWCGDSDGRLIPLCIIPLWDAELAAQEVRRNAERGVRAVAFSEIPAFLGLPSIHTKAWDPFFAACEETGTVVCMHIGSSSRMTETSKDAPNAVGLTLTFNYSMASLADFLFSGVLVRFPKLRLAYSEGQIGWIPYILERADSVWEEQRGWAGADDIPEPPSTYYYRQVYGCFFRDAHGLESLDRVGVDNVTFESDYPHGDGTWPRTAEVARELMGHLENDVVEKIVRGNAIRMLQLDEAGLRRARPRPGGDEGALIDSTRQHGK